MDELKGDKDAGARLKSLRDEMRASQRAFGAPLGFNQAAVSAFEQGRVIFRKSDALAVEYVYGIHHEWLLFGIGPKVRESEVLTEDERELLRIHRAIEHRDRPTWLKVGRLLAEVWDGTSERRGRDRRRSERRVADRNPPECAALPRDRGSFSKDTPAASGGAMRRRRRLLPHSSKLPIAPRPLAGIVLARVAQQEAALLPLSRSAYHRRECTARNALHRQNSHSGKSAVRGPAATGVFRFQTARQPREGGALRLSCRLTRRLAL